MCGNLSPKKKAPTRLKVALRRVTSVKPAVTQSILTVILGDYETFEFKYTGFIAVDLKVKNPSFRNQ